MRDQDVDQLLLDERRHRWAALHGDCPDCAPHEEMVAFLEPPQPFEEREWWAPDAAPAVLTPEGELAQLVSGYFRVEDRSATESALGTLFCGDGPDHLDLVRTPDGGCWLRGCVWWAPEDDGLLAFEATSYERFQWIEYRLARLWPPVFRGMHGGGYLQDRELDLEPFPSRRTGRWGLPPTRAALRHQIIAAEQRWLRAPSALLDGAVPAALGRTPEGRARLVDVLRAATRRPAAEVGGVASFSADRVLAAWEGGDDCSLHA